MAVELKCESCYDERELWKYANTSYQQIAGQHAALCDTHYFVTLTVLEWIDIFTKPEYYQVITDSLNYCRAHKRLKVYEYVIMTNHLHLIVGVSGEDASLAQVLSDVKKHTTRELWKLIEKDNRGYIKNLLNNSFKKKTGYAKQVWQRENYPEVIYSDEFLTTKAKYIHENPVKKEYVRNPEDWRYSSAYERIIGKLGDVMLDKYD